MKPIKVYKKIGLLSIMRYFTLSLRIIFLVFALNLSIDYLVILFGMPLSQLSLIFSLTPGAMGFLEGGWFVVFLLAGIDKASTSLFLLGQRFFWLIFNGLILIIPFVFNRAWFINKTKMIAKQILDK